MSRRSRTSSRTGSKRRCRNCPPEPEPNTVQLAAEKAIKRVEGAELSVTLQGESQRLWNHVLFGTATCIGMLEGYARLGLPGNPKSQIDEMIRRLTQISETYEDQPSEK